MRRVTLRPEHGLFAVVWLTAACWAASADPSQIQLALTPEDDEMVVWWVTKDKTGPSTVQYGRSPHNLDLQQVVTDEPFFVQEPKNPDGYRSDWMHEVVLKGLWAATRYFYRCGDPEGGWSSVYSFVTRRRPDAPTRFAVFSDQGTLDRKYKGSKAVVAALKSTLSQYDLYLHLGDMSYADGNQPEWDKYGEHMEQYTARLPGAVAVGNHERDSREMLFDSFLARWRHGETGKGDDAFYWSFNYGPMHIAVLSSEHKNGQTEWLEQDLKMATLPENRLRRPWIIALIHRPVFADKRKILGSRADRDGLRRVIEKYGVDLMLSGHCHNYERLYPYRFWAEQVTHETDGQGSRPYITNAFERQPPRSDAPGSDFSSDRSEVQDSSDDTTANGQLGTIQLIIGTAGHGTFTKCKRQPGLTFGDTLNVFGFGQFEVSRQQLVFKMVDQNGKVLDQMKMCTRPRCAPPPPLDPPPPPPRVAAPPPPPLWAWRPRDQGPAPRPSPLPQWSPQAAPKPQQMPSPKAPVQPSPPTLPSLSPQALVPMDPPSSLSTPVFPDPAHEEAPITPAVVFLMEFRDLSIAAFDDTQYDRQFRSEFTTELKVSANCPECGVIISSITAGSVVVNASLLFPVSGKPIAARSASEMAQGLAINPGALFSAKFIDSYGLPNSTILMSGSRLAFESETGIAENKQDESGNPTAEEVGHDDAVPIASTIGGVDGEMEDEYEDSMYYYYDEKYQDTFSEETVSDEVVQPMPLVDSTDDLLKSITSKSDPGPEGSKDTKVPIAWVIGGILMVLGLSVGILVTVYYVRHFRAQSEDHASEAPALPAAGSASKDNSCGPEEHGIPSTTAVEAVKQAPNSANLADAAAESYEYSGPLSSSLVETGCLRTEIAADSSMVCSNPLYNKRITQDSI